MKIETKNKTWGDLSELTHELELHKRAKQLFIKKYDATWFLFFITILIFL
jgi:hypothetical protein